MKLTVNFFAFWPPKKKPFSGKKKKGQKVRKETSTRFSEESTILILPSFLRKCRKENRLQFLSVENKNLHSTNTSIRLCRDGS